MSKSAPSKRRSPDPCYSIKSVKDTEIIFAAFDVETRGLGGDLLLIQWGIFGEIKTCDAPDMVECFISDVFKYPDPVVWYCHNAQYDFRYLMDYFVKNEIPIKVMMRTDNDVYELRILSPSGKWCILRDSYAFWNSTLSDLAKTFCPHLPKLEIDIQNFDPKNPEHLTYARRDVEILLAAMPILDEKIRRHFGVGIGPTTAGTSVRAWQKTLPENEKHYCSRLGARELFIRQAYYGGVVFLTTNRTVDNCLTFDINSSYPYVMDKFGVPGGAVCEGQEVDYSLPGIYHCVIRAPDNLKIPIIPSRDKTGGVQWRKGVFETVVTSFELDFAVNHGYEILKVISGLKWEKMIFPFSPFVEKCKVLRKEHKGRPEEKLAKLMQNSLYGKFGSRRERRALLAAHCSGDDELIGAIPYDDAGKWYVKKEVSESQKCKPEWAVFITARARLNLMEVAYRVGPDSCFYGDTDSLVIRADKASLVPTGDDYGQFKLEKKWRHFRPIAPKVYAGVLESGEYYGAAKGLPSRNLTAGNWRELLEEGHTAASAYSLDSLRLTLKNGVSPATVLLRKSSTIDNSKNYSLVDGEIELKCA